MYAAPLLFPEYLRVETITIHQHAVVVTASAKAPTVPCPVCGKPSGRVHSRYTRTIADLPWATAPAVLRVRIRKHFCDNKSCPRKVFAERLDGVARRYARRTERQRKEFEWLGLALGGEAGARLAERFGMGVSGDTLLRLVHQTAISTIAATTRVLGVDEWSWRRGSRFGTILVDLELHRVVDLMPDRKADEVAEWLRSKPGVEVISRDRAGVYAEAAAKGAPGAVQVADRFHLLANLSDCLERCLLGRAGSLKGAAAALEGREPGREPEPEPQAWELRAEEASLRRHGRRVERYEQIRRLREAGADVADIARTLGVTRRTVYRYKELPEPPKRRRMKGRPHLLDPYKEYLLKRWAEGCHNKRRLYKEIRERGYEHSEANVVRFLLGLERGNGAARAMGPSKPRVRVPSARHAASLLVRRPQELTGEQREYLAKLCELDETVAKAYELAKDFGVMLRNLKGERLDGWIGRAKESGIGELARFAKGLLEDEAAVRAGLTLHWSQGQVEGQVHRLKLLKRQAYGRAGFELLRKRVLLAA